MFKWSSTFGHGLGFSAVAAVRVAGRVNPPGAANATSKDRKKCKLPKIGWLSLLAANKYFTTLPLYFLSVCLQYLPFAQICYSCEPLPIGGRKIRNHLNELRRTVLSNQKKTSSDLRVTDFLFIFCCA